ncbi:MAG: [protein-PII] uridylyltransferase, partial [Hyphomicrobiales bacterium]|nr:[protein-PII] uridylyltransferase [Hyphomicrobiales bacterium]
MRVGPATRAVAAALESGAAGETLRAASMDACRRSLDEGHAAARAALEAGGRGVDCARALSASQDDVTQAVVRAASRLAGVAPDELARMSSVAVGGYGRGLMAPGSDVDLLFLTPDAGRARIEKAVEAALYLLWDLKLKVGHATRTVEECLDQAQADMTIRTTLLEARRIDGDGALFERLRKDFDDKVVAAGPREFVAAKLAERDQRLSKAGAARYVVEPNVKEGKGGLRDLNTLFWIAQYVCRAREVADFVAAGLFTRREAATFRRCEEFLWSVRCHLHFQAGRAEERLSFERQPGIAAALGYRDRGGMSAVERFMKHYFLVAKDVGDLTNIVCAALEARHAKPKAALDRFVKRLRRPKLVEGAGDFAIENGRIALARPDAFARDPVNLVRIFWAAQRSGLALHPDATRAVSLSLRSIGRETRADPEANRLFLEILTSRPSPETVLRRMNEAGVLGRFIPEFGRVVAMMQFSLYHHYTVDEHLLRSVGALADMEAQGLRDEHPVATEIFPTISNRRALYVATFLHDVAKGRPEDHSIAGARIVRELGPRLGLDARETATAAWLVEHHLHMSTIAQTRDLSDPATIEAFARLVQSPERLKLLLLLTVADIRAVGPGVWNGWKGQLLRTLYWETEPHLAGGHSAIDRDAKVASAQAALRARLPGWSDDEFDAYARRHRAPYWLRVDVERKVAHAKLLRARAEGGEALVTAVSTDRFRGYTEVTVVAPDHPRLLSTVAGACAAAGGNIVDAQIFTTTDGLALDAIFLARAFETDADELRRAGR